MKMKVDEKAGGLLRHGPALLVLFVAILFVHDIFGAHGYLSMRRTQDGIKKVKAEIARLNKENAALEQAVKQAENALQKHDSRRARPGEIIIKIPQSQLLPQAFNTHP